MSTPNCLLNEGFSKCLFLYIRNIEWLITLFQVLKTCYNIFLFVCLHFILMTLNLLHEWLHNKHLVRTRCLFFLFLAFEVLTRECVLRLNSYYSSTTSLTFQWMLTPALSTSPLLEGRINSRGTFEQPCYTAISLNVFLPYRRGGMARYGACDAHEMPSALSRLSSAQRCVTDWASEFKQSWISLRNEVINKSLIDTWKRPTWGQLQQIWAVW